MLLNCDLGESFGNWTMGVDAAVMPHIDQANIACGFHAGDPTTMGHTLDLAARHKVAIGAHPAYPDLVGFGRRSMQLTASEIIANLHYQVGALQGLAQSRNLALAHIKPHGALYNDMMSDPKVRAAIMAAVASYHQPLVLVVQATAHNSILRTEADAAGITVMFEAFADRCYNDDGSLVSRDQPQAVHDKERALAQAAQLAQDQSVTTASGARLPLQADTLCVHGDNHEAVLAIADIAASIDG